MIDTNFIKSCIKSGGYDMVNISEAADRFVCALEVLKPENKKDNNDGQLEFPEIKKEEGSAAALKGVLTETSVLLESVPIREAD